MTDAVAVPVPRVPPWGLAVVHVFSTEGPIDIDGARWRVEGRR